MTVSKSNVELIMEAVTARYSKRAIVAVEQIGEHMFQATLTDGRYIYAKVSQYGTVSLDCITETA